MQELITGQNIKLANATKLSLRFYLPTVSNLYALSSCAFVLNEQGKTRYENDFVFFNNLISVASGLQKKATADEFNFDLRYFPNEVSKIIFSLTIDDGESRGLHFSALNGCYAELINADNNEKIALFKPQIQSMNETSLFFVEVYRHKQDWKLRALGQGVSSELEGLVARFGVNEALPPLTSQNVPPAPSPPEQESPPPLPPPQPAAIPVAKILVGALVILAMTGIFVWYQNYEAQQAINQKQERILFAQAVTEEDFKNYLASCETCEEKTAAQARIFEFSKKQHDKTQRELDIQQEHQTFVAADTPEKLIAYSYNCVYCADKKHVAEKRRELAQQANARTTQPVAMPEQQIKLGAKREQPVVEEVLNWLWKSAAQILTDKPKQDEPSQQQKETAE